MKANRNWRMAIVILLTSSVIVLSLLLLRAKDPMTAKANEIQSVPYKLLHDDNGDSINIGVPENANEEQLRATLVKAANEHQDDPARDYFGLYFWINAYLLQDGQPSKAPAGRLRRFVPFANPEERKNMTGDRARFDAFEISLDKARKSLPGSLPAQTVTGPEILADGVERVIVLSVDAEITDEQLRAQLSEAARTHQNERDACSPGSIRVEAYLTKSRHRSSIPAGRLERVIPILDREDPAGARIDWSKFDKITITTEEARKTLPL